MPSSNKFGLLQFQSSPAPKDGRYAVLTGHRVEWLRVSILARPEGRALLWWGVALLLPAGVSILARPEGRALLR